MSDASAAMREWRRGQAATAAPVAVAVPGRVQQASQTALAALWAEAQAIANDALKAAQGAWEAEREEAEALRREMSAAFEAQTAETEALQARLAAMENQAVATAAELAEVRLKLAHTRGQLEAAQAQQAALLTAIQTSAERSEAEERTLFGLDGKESQKAGKPPAKPQVAKGRNLDIEDPRS
jgi:predicted  nucleic acid-binding Zn-ribbon protein